MFFSDVPMSVGILNIRSQSSYTNELEFEWDTQVEAQVYIKVKRWKYVLGLLHKRGVTQT